LGLTTLAFQEAARFESLTAPPFPNEAGHWNSGESGMKMKSVAILAILVSPLPAWACSCAPDGSAAEEYSGATVVFLGKVLSLKQSPTVPDQSRFLTEEATLVVEKAWKGVAVGDHVQIKSNLGPGPCGVSLRNDPVWLESADPKAPVPVFSDVWVVYGHGKPPFEVSGCSRSSPLNLSGEDEAKLLDTLKK
jgi:hypothetical protein